jgi:hypothetical protein
MSHVRITLSKEMLKALLTNLSDLQSPAGEFVVENEINGINEITRIINLFSGDVFEQTVQRQENENDSQEKKECRIYEFPIKTTSEITPEDDLEY